MGLVKSSIFLTAFNVYSTGHLMTEFNIKKGEFILLMLVLGLLEQNESVSKFDIIKANRTNENMCYSHLKQLQDKGFIQTTRTNQYFARTFVSLTPKGLLFKSKLRKALKEVPSIPK